MAGCTRHKQLTYIPKLTCGIYFHFFHHFSDKISLKWALLFSERFCSKIDIYNWIVLNCLAYTVFFSLIEDISCNDLCPI